MVQLWLYGTIHVLNLRTIYCFIFGYICLFLLLFMQYSSSLACGWCWISVGVSFSSDVPFFKRGLAIGRVRLSALSWDKRSAKAFSTINVVELLWKAISESCFDTASKFLFRSAIVRMCTPLLGNFVSVLRNFSLRPWTYQNDVMCEPNDTLLTPWSSARSKYLSYFSSSGIVSPLPFISPDRWTHYCLLPTSIISSARDVMIR